MKNLIILFTLLIGTLTYSQRPGSFSQNGKHSEKIRTAKITHITNELELTSLEAEKFWPIYNEYDKKRMKLRRFGHKTIKKTIQEKDGLDNLTEKEASDLLNSIEKNKDAIHKLEKAFLKNIKKILPVKKILKLYKAEKDFNRKLLHRLKGKRK